MQLKTDLYIDGKWVKGNGTVPVYDPSDGSVIAEIQTAGEKECDFIEEMISLFHREGVHGPINLGNPSPKNMFNLVNELISLRENNSQMKKRILPFDGPKTCESDIEKNRRSSAWQLNIVRRAGLIETIEFSHKAESIFCEN